MRYFSNLPENKERKNNNNTKAGNLKQKLRGIIIKTKQNKTQVSTKQVKEWRKNTTNRIILQEEEKTKKRAECLAGLRNQDT